MMVQPPKFYIWFWCALALGTVPANARAFCIGGDKTFPSYDPQYYSVDHEFRRATYVIKAKVIRETWLGDDGKEKALQPPFQNGGSRPWGFDPYLGAYYDVQVETPFKGKPPLDLRLFSENSTARFWFDVGSEHVLFVTEETFDQPIGRSPNR